MTIKLLSYNNGSASAKTIAKALGIKMLKQKNSAWQGKAGDTIINWGSSAHFKNAGDAVYLNFPFDVGNATNKLKTQNKFELKPYCLPFTTDKGVAETMIDGGGTVVCRTKLTGNSGEGIVIASTKEELVDAPLYTVYKKKTDEFRVHIVCGEVISIQRKARVKDVEDDKVNWQVRNLEGGFIFQRTGFEVPPIVVEHARDAVATLQLDFGAVDVGFHKDGTFVYEVNTACGLEGSNAYDYTEALCRNFGLPIPAKPEDYVPPTLPDTKVVVAPVAAPVVAPVAEPALGTFENPRGIEGAQYTHKILISADFSALAGDYKIPTAIEMDDYAGDWVWSQAPDARGYYRASAWTWTEDMMSSICDNHGVVRLLEGKPVPAPKPVIAPKPVAALDLVLGTREHPHGDKDKAIGVGLIKPELNDEDKIPGLGINGDMRGLGGQWIYLEKDLKGRKKYFRSVGWTWHKHYLQTLIMFEAPVEEDAVEHEEGTFENPMGRNIGRSTKALVRADLTHGEYDGVGITKGMADVFRGKWIYISTFTLDKRCNGAGWNWGRGCFATIVKEGAAVDLDAIKAEHVAAEDVIELGRKPLQFMVGNLNRKLNKEQQLRLAGFIADL